MSSSESMELSSEIFEEVPESQWIQENHIRDPKSEPSQQWSQLPDVPGLVPVTCEEPPPAYPAAPSQPQYNLPNGSYPPRHMHHSQPNPSVPIPNHPSNDPRNYSYMDISFVNRPSSSFCNPSRPNGFPRTPNAPHQMLPTGPLVNGWMPQQHPSRFVTRPGWTPAKNLPNNPSGSNRKTKRIRTAFSSHQMGQLETEYSKARYLDRNRRIELAELLQLNERTIKIWFQNRRMKEKKDKKEALEQEQEEQDEATSTTTDSSNELNGVIIPPGQMIPIHGSVYVEYSPVPTPEMMSAPVLVDQQAPMMNTWGYMPQEYIDMQHCHPPPPYRNSIQEIIHESPLQVEPPAPMPSTVTESKWDCSWFKTLTDDC